MNTMRRNDMNNSLATDQLAVHQAGGGRKIGFPAQSPVGSALMTLIKGDITTKETTTNVSGDLAEEGKKNRLGP
jgi:hypothetical protein